jgi:hypothetical protein
MGVRYLGEFFEREFEGPHSHSTVWSTLIKPLGLGTN